MYDLSSVSRYETRLKKREALSYLITYCLSASRSFSEQDGHGENEEEEEEVNYELNCLDDLMQRKLAIMLHGLARVAHIDCNKKEAADRICTKLKPSWAAPIILYSRLPDLDDKADNMSVSTVLIKTADYKKIVQTVLSHLPDVNLLDEERFKVTCYYH